MQLFIRNILDLILYKKRVVDLTLRTNYTVYTIDLNIQQTKEFVLYREQ